MIFGEINIAFFDWPWTGIHWLSGFIVGAILMSALRIRTSSRFWPMGFAVLLAWELTEVTLRLLDTHAHDAIAPFKAAVGGFAFAPEATANIVGDMIIGLVGVWFGRGLGRRLAAR